jgi:aspartyl-tRNA(Asn)/glutamyl-tRNA(Gln) amidotransferase subunit B
MNKNRNNELRTKNYEPVIGLEVHVELKTKSKMFCGCIAEYFGLKPNSNTCPVCLGLPGALPVPNKKAIEWCIMIGLALNCKINNFSKFDRKNYFYPDLPKGYQISQYDMPFAANGLLNVANRKSHVASRGNEERKANTEKRIRIRRVHMEEDTAKLVHQLGAKSYELRTKNSAGHSLIDFNRSGVPLVEIVTEPDFENSEQVVEYLKKLQQIVRFLQVSDADMEKGNMRLEPNISLKINDKGLINNLPKYKVEVKNINSFRFVQKAIDYEIKRQSEILDKGETPVQETRGWDDQRQKTVSQRKKEEADDYRYFPEPDIPPITYADSKIQEILNLMPELPDKKTERFIKMYSLNNYDADILTRTVPTSNFFEELVKIGKNHNLTPKQIANHMINKKITIHEDTAEIVVKKITESLSFQNISEEALIKKIEEILAENQKAVTNYKEGKTQVVGFLIGKVRSYFPSASVQQIKIELENQLK